MMIDGHPLSITRFHVMQKERKDHTLEKKSIQRAK